MSFQIEGQDAAHRSWSGSTDDEGHRNYEVVYRVKGETTDGPALAMQCEGLPEAGSIWSIDSDVDSSAFFTEKRTAKPVISDGADKYFDVTCYASSKPLPPDKQRCNDTKIEDPLLEPPKINGSFVNYNEEATEDRFGFPILTSSHEQIRGPQVEFSKNRGRVVIEQNVATPYQGYILPSIMMNTVNAFPLWGLPARTILLSEAPWERRFYGSCYIYYNRKLTFDIDINTFDRDILDEGGKVLHGHWGNDGHWVLDEIDGEDPDPANPSHFDRFKDKKGENCKVILNGEGLPAGVCVDWPSGSQTEAPQYYIRVGDEATLGTDPQDEDFWALAGSIPPQVQAWNDLETYERGDVVTFDGILYVAWSRNTSEAPSSSTNWDQLPVGINNQDYYSPFVTYAPGDYVIFPVYDFSGTGTSDACAPTNEGEIHVEYYSESDFLMLGIPLSF